MIRVSPSDLIFSSPSRLVTFAGLFVEAAGSHSYFFPQVGKRKFVFQCPAFAGLVFWQGILNMV